MAAATRKKAGKSPQSQLDDLLDKYTPEVAAAARQCLKKMKARLPGATQLVYDTYNALGIGFRPSEKASEVIFSSFTPSTSPCSVCRAWACPIQSDCSREMAKWFGTSSSSRRPILDKPAI